MNVVRVTKEFNFDMAHALYRYDGKCAHIHGHSYFMEVTVIGNPLGEEGHPKAGMVMDFSDLKKIVHDEVISLFDHALVLKETDPRLNEVPNSYENIVSTSYQPTCENMVIDFADRIGKKIKAPLRLYSIKLRETASSYACWYADDN